MRRMGIPTAADSPAIGAGPSPSLYGWLYREGAGHRRVRSWLAAVESRGRSIRSPYGVGFVDAGKHRNCGLASTLQRALQRRLPELAAFIARHDGHAHRWLWRESDGAIVSVSPTEVVFEVPPEAAAGVAMITIMSADGIVSLTSAPLFPTYYFPHLAAGGGWQTTFTYVNVSSQAVTCDTSFFADDGSPLRIAFTGGSVSTRTDTLNAGVNTEAYRCGYGRHDSRPNHRVRQWSGSFRVGPSRIALVRSKPVCSSVLTIVVLLWERLE